MKEEVEVVIIAKRNAKRKRRYIVMARWVEKKEIIEGTGFGTRFQFLAIAHFKKLVKQFKLK